MEILPCEPGKASILNTITEFLLPSAYANHLERFDAPGAKIVLADAGLLQP
jgi:hypothetical protein